MRVGTSVEVMVASDQSARPAWAGRVDVQQLQQLGLQRRWGGDGWWVVAVGGVEAQPGQGFEHQPAGRLGWSAGIQLGKFDGGAIALRTARSTRQNTSSARQIMVISAAMRRLVLRNIGATPSGPLNAP